MICFYIRKSNKFVAIQSLLVSKKNAIMTVNNQWDQVESMRGVPAFFIPKAISNYVRSNYRNLAITKVNKEYHGYEIELANGMDLNFDNSGRFLGMDD